MWAQKQSGAEEKTSSKLSSPQRRLGPPPPPLCRRFRKGVGGRGLPTNKPPKKSPKVLQKCVPILLRGLRKKGTEKRPKSLGFEGFLRANPLCPPTPFRNFWVVVLLLFFFFLCLKLKSGQTRHTLWRWPEGSPGNAISGAVSCPCPLQPRCPQRGFE